MKENAVHELTSWIALQNNAWKINFHQGLSSEKMRQIDDYKEMQREILEVWPLKIQLIDSGSIKVI